MLLGRAEEMAAIDALLTAAGDGTSGCLVLSGEPGIGKSALLQYAAGSASGLQVASVAGIESELNLGFAGVHRLLLPFLGLREDLPEPQRDALGAAFGLVSSAPADRFLVGLAVLTLLADVANDRPLLCVVDDVQWMDQESIEVLAFVARRLHAERIALLFAARPSTSWTDLLAGVDRLTLEGLGEADAGALLARSASAPLHPSVARRILDETQGNPLALEELARDLSVDESTGASPLPAPLPLGERLEASFLHQARSLPIDTQTLLLVAAAETSGDPEVIRRAGLGLGIPPAASDPAVSAGLVTFRPRVEFRHPLVRSAIYGGAPLADRRRVHRALADATDREHHSDRRSLHLAAASLGPDEDVAVELERSAVRARNRGGYAAEASLLTRAAELSPDSVNRATRLLDAAEAALSGGNVRRARLLLDQAVPDLETPLLRATARRIEGLLMAPMAQSSQATAVLMDAAQAFIPLDRAIARDAWLEALDNYLIAFSFIEGTTREEAARAALEFLANEASPKSTEDLVLEALATRIGAGVVDAVPSLRQVADRLRDAEFSGDDLLRWLNVGPWVANDLFDDETYRTVATRLERLARERGALKALQVALLCTGSFETRAGRFSHAQERYAEVVAVTEMRGDYVPFYELLDVELLAWRGDDVATRTKARVLEEQGTAVGSYATVYMGWLALAVLELGQGHYREALEWSLRVTDGDPPGFGCQALPNIVEAGVRCGERAAAADALAQLESRALASAAPHGLGLLARSKAQLAEDPDAEPFYRTAIELLGSSHWVTELARAHLVYGEWLRRVNRRLDAREQLRAAHDMFSSMGARAFAERARLELVSTGERARKATVETTLDLTPQEAHIARLAAERVTSREIAAQLFISSRTVEYHLGKIFRKLDVTSRRELAAALANEPVSIAEAG